MNGKALSKAVAAILGIWLTSGATASAGLTFTADAQYTAGGHPTLVAGMGLFVDASNLVNTANGFSLSNGSWTYISAAADIGVPVKIAYMAERTFTYTDGNYVTVSSVDVPSVGPAGVLGHFTLETMVKGLNFLFNTDSNVDVAFNLLGNMSVLAVRASDTSDEFTPGGPGGDILITEGAVEFTPTAANQAFSFMFPTSLDSSILTVVPEPSSLSLILVGGSIVFASAWQRRRTGRKA